MTDRKAAAAGMQIKGRDRDDFQDRIRMINSSTRKQIEANFEGVENADVRGVDVFREYAEIVKG